MSFNKILRWVIYGGLFAITLTPLIVTPNSFISLSLFFPFITGKNFFFRILVEIVAGLWLILAYRDKTARPKSSWILWSLLAYLGIATLATVFGQNPIRSFWSNFERMEGLIAYIHNFLFFLVLVSVVKTKETWRWLLKTSLGVSVITSWIALLQLAGKAEIHQSGSRLDATLGNSAYLAVYMLFSIFVAVYLLITSRNKIAKWIYGVIAFLETIILYYTATRGALLGLIGGVVLILIFAAWRKQGPVRKATLSALVAIVALIIIFIGVRNTPVIKENQVLSRFATLSWNDPSILARKQIWTMSFEGFKEHPILGWGPENYPLVFQKYYTPNMYSQEPWFDRSHNIVLDNLINAGLLGLLSYLAIFIAAVYYLWRSKGGTSEQDLWSRVILGALLVAYFFQNLTVFDNLVSIIMFYIILGLIHFSWASEETVEVHQSAKASTEDGAWLPVVVLVAIGATVFSVYYFNVRGINVSTTLIRAISPQTDTAAPLADFKQIFSHSEVMGLTEAREQLMSVSQGILQDQNVSNDIKSQYLNLVTNEMTKEFASDNNNAREHLFYGSFLTQIGSADQAITELEKARQLAPKKQMILIELGSEYINVGQKDKGLDLFKQAYEEDTSYADAHRLYALAALYVGNTQLADQILGTDPIQYTNDDRFLTYYLNTKQYGKVLQIWQARYAANPNDKQTNISLAGAYYYAGNPAKAIEVVQKYIAKDQTFASQGGAIIKSIELGQIK